jgi:N-acetylmuramoyl-L-alanine amidase
LKDRTIKAKEKSANLYLSLHHDSVQNEYINYWRYKNGKNHYSDDFSGYSIFVSYKNHDVNQSLIFAKYLGEELFSSGFTPTLHHAEKIKGENRKLLDKKLGIYQFDDLVVLKTAQMPAVLLECGIIVNRKEELLLNSDTFREEFSRGIVNAIKKYKNSFKGKK